MPAGDPGKEQFRDAITTLRNRAIIGYIGQVFNLRNEVLGNSEIAIRSGFETPVQAHFNDLLINLDRWRRRITYNPSGKDLKDLEAEARKLDENISGAKDNPQSQAGGTGAGTQTSIDNAGGDDEARPAGGLRILPFALDGSDPNIKLLSQLELRNPLALDVIGAIDEHIVSATRLEDRLLTTRITWYGSLLLYSGLKDIWMIINAFGGDNNQLPIAAGVLPAEEPRGPLASPNSKGEVSGAGPAAK